MADISTSIAEAKRSGYSDAEIATYLGSDAKLGGQIKDARQSGYSDGEIVQHLASSARPKPNFFDQVGGAVTGAVDKLKADVGADRQATLSRVGKSAPNLFQAAASSVDDLRRKAGIIGDVAGVVASPVAGAINAAVLEPGANLFDKMPAQAYSRPQLSLDGGKLSVRGPQPLDAQQTHEANKSAISTALMGARAPAAAAAAAAPASSPNLFASNVQRFDQAGVTPMMAATGGKGTSAVANVIAENPIAGAAVRNRLQRAVGETGASAQRIANQFGETRGPQITGENVQAGVTRFAQDKNAPTSFAAKAGSKYDDVFGKLDAAMQGKTNPGRMQAVADDQFAHSAAIGGSQIETPSTAQALQQISGGTQSTSIGKLISDPTLSKAANALETAQGARDMSFNDLRRLRTWTRDAQKNPELRQNIGAANLQRLEGSLTQDIYSNAEKLGSPELAQQLRRTDQFYAAGQQRIQNALDSFASAKSGEGAYSRVQQAAGSSSTADAQKLLSLKRSLSPDEWGDVAANTVSEMGKQTPGAAPAGEAGFSVSHFVTNYNNLSARGRDVLFGSMGGGGSKASQLRASLDNLASVADDLKGIEKGANTSKSGVSLQSAATIGGLVNPLTFLPTMKVLAVEGLTGEALTNPVVIRWLARMGSASKVSPGALSAVNKQLQNAAQKNAALLPLYHHSMKLLAPPLQLTTKSLAASPDQQSAPL